jgi:hypothetical protein
LYRLGSISIEEIESIGPIQIRNNKVHPMRGMLTTLCSKDKKRYCDDAELELKKYPNAKLVS